MVFFTDFGFDKSFVVQSAIEVIYLLVVFFGFVSLMARYLNRFRPAQAKVWVFDLLYLLSLLSVFYHELVELQILPFNNLFGKVWWVKLMVVFVFVREFSERDINYKRAQFNPAQLFILSFLSIILVGTLFLMLPNAT
ncbi:MAG TPA: ATPase, partial [Flavobacteriaceae bacterium]|nr:ATPase [Flavobacteriaceae bacterium]